MLNQLADKVILVTGANGFIGRHLTERLCKVGAAKLLLLSRQRLETAQHGVISFSMPLQKLTREYWHSQNIEQIDYVFHLGAFTPKTTTEGNHIDKAVESNVLGTWALLGSLPGKIAKIIFTSSIDVYAAADSGQTLTEESPVAPSTLYGASKVFCERLISAWATEKRCEFAILRYGHIYGPGEEQYGKMIPNFIRKLLANQAPVIYGDGSVSRDYLFVSDAVEATIRAAAAEGSIELLNIVRGESVTLKHVTQLLIRLIGSDRKIELLPDQPNAGSLRFDNHRMNELLGSWPLTCLEDGLAAEVENFRKAKYERT